MPTPDLFLTPTLMNADHPVSSHGREKWMLHLDVRARRLYVWFMQAPVDAIREFYLRHRWLRAPVVRFRHRKLHDEDAFVVSYPRSGSTWFRFLLYESLSGEPSEFERVHISIPAVGKHFDAPRLLPNGGRLVGSHELFCDGPRRIVYIVRDPRSIVISQYKLRRRQGVEHRDFQTFVEAFATGKGNPFGSWAEHTSYWLSGESAQRGRLHLVKFEDLRNDPKACLEAALQFLGTHQNPEAVTAVVSGNTVEQMQAKEDRAPREVFRKAKRHEVRFVNSGSVGGWSSQLTPEQTRLIESNARDEMLELGYHLEAV